MNGSNIAGGNPKLGRVSNDYYATNPKDSKAFFDLINKKYNFDKIIEPAAGGGTFIRPNQRFFSPEPSYWV